MEIVKKHLLKYLLYPLLLLLLPLTGESQGWSYVYLQGDKETPFYVKLEGTMLPRYGKNYAILPQLEAGPINIQILFQQNKYPPQNFTVLVPGNGYRGFLVTRKGNDISLFDIQQQFYLAPGDQDRLPDPGAPSLPPANLPEEKEEEITETKTEVVKADRPKSTVSKPIAAKKTKAPPTVVKKPVPVPKRSESEPVFIENLVLNSERSAPNGSEVSTKTEPPASSPIEPETGPEVNLESGKAPIPNSDCIGPMTAEAFNKLLAGIEDKEPNDKLVVFFLRQTDDNCFTTQQVYHMALKLESESVRFSFLKNVYPLVTDQQNFPLLEPYLFQSNEWKEYFRSIQ